MQAKIPLPEAARAWGTEGFEDALKRALAALGADVLPLQAALAHTSVALDDGIEVIVLAAREQDGAVHVRAGVFYQGIVAGCGCADDPTPVTPEAEYCEIEVVIDLGSAQACITLL